MAAEKALNAQFAKELEMASFGGDAANGGEDDTSMKTGNSTSSKKKIKRVNDAGLGGHPIVKQLLHKKSSKAHTQGGTTQSLELKIEDLDEAQLKKRLATLDRDLEEYKKKCAYYKTENEWYRNEIESTEKDTAAYLAHLESKEEEKIRAINGLQDARKRDVDLFTLKRMSKEEDNKIKIQELKNVIQDLELKLDDKQQAMMSMSDIMAKRSKHEAEIARIQREIKEADASHIQSAVELERSLLETRIKLQREADNKISEMESAAQEKAAKYLNAHTTSLEDENEKLEKELRECIHTTQRLLARKQVLERENKEMEMEQKMREGLVKIRLEQIADAQKQEKARRKKLQEMAIVEKVKILSSENAKQLEKRRNEKELLARVLPGTAKVHQSSFQPPESKDVRGGSTEVAHSSTSSNGIYQNRLQPLDEYHGSISELSIDPSVLKELDWDDDEYLL